MPTPNKANSVLSGFPDADSNGLGPEVMLNALDAVLIIGVAIPCLLMAFKVKQPKLRLLTALLSLFLLLHGSYHGLAALGTLAGFDAVGQLSDLVVEPLGWAIFLAFAVYLWRYSG